MTACPMKITILTTGSRGDVQPFIALGLGLRQVDTRSSSRPTIPFRRWCSAMAWSLPRSLAMSRPSPPVYVGFGSISGENPAQFTQVVLEALKLTGQRGVLLTGSGGISQTDLPDQVFLLDSAPHDWLFPQMAAIVHHGGAGTTAAALKAGVPSVVVPFFGDQPFWGDRVHRLGTSPAPVPKSQLTADRLATAIAVAVWMPKCNSKPRRSGRQFGPRMALSRLLKSCSAIATEYLSPHKDWSLPRSRRVTMGSASREAQKCRSDLSSGNPSGPESDG